MNFDIEKHRIFETLTGSHAYGLATPESDYDYKGIAIPPIEYFLGSNLIFEQYEEKGMDRVIYEIRKFVKLATDCNPNIIELLWVPTWCIKIITPLGEKLLAMRELFLSKKARHTFSGYAIAQLKRIKTHRKWLLDPPLSKPTRSDFELPEVSVITADIQGVIRSLEEKNADLRILFSSEVMTIYQRERQYHNALREWQQYQDWKKTRNEKRAELEKKFGYDTKHAMHLVRLMRMCREILEKGEVVVKRPDREELLGIRNGVWAYDELTEWAEKQDKELTDIYETSNAIPHSPSIHRASELCMELVEAFHGIFYKKTVA